MISFEDFFSSQPLSRLASDLYEAGGKVCSMWPKALSQFMAGRASASETEEASDFYEKN